MAKNPGGNGGDTPPEGDRPFDPELPELPPDWGQVPDDPSELAAEAERIRAELAQERLTGRRGPAAEEPDEVGAGSRQSIGTPLVIMSVAVVITLVSLFAMAWSGTSGLTNDRPGLGGGAVAASELPPITLTDPAGRQVLLEAQVPMALLLVEECDCQNLLAATAAAAPAGVRVVAVGHSPPDPPAGLAPGDPQPLRLGDPAGVVRSELGLAPPTDTATVVLIDREGQVRHSVPSATSVAQFQAELTNLGP